MKIWCPIGYVPAGAPMNHALLRSFVIASAVAGSLLGGCIETSVGAALPPAATPLARPIDNVQQVDRIVQTTVPVVDILWTIDNSCSMSDDQDSLAENFPFFMDYFAGSGLDYHVGVVSTDLDDPSHSGKLQAFGPYKYIDVNTQDPVAIFQEMATMGDTGSGNEKGIGATFLALETLADTVNLGFVRNGADDNASLHTVCITDEKDYTQDSLISDPEFVEWYSELKPEADQRTFSGIVNMAGFDRSASYITASDRIGGIIWDIKSSDWSDVLRQLGIQASGLKREYYLSQVPVEDTIVVQVDDSVSGATIGFDRAVYDETNQLVSGEWEYNTSRNSVTFVQYVPNALSTVVLTYTKLSELQTVEEVVEPGATAE
jgi:hypothetical protein